MNGNQGLIIASNVYISCDPENKNSQKEKLSSLKNDNKSNHSNNIEFEENIKEIICSLIKNIHLENPSSGYICSSNDHKEQSNSDGAHYSNCDDEQYDCDNFPSNASRNTANDQLRSDDLQNGNNQKKSLQNPSSSKRSQERKNEKLSNDDINNLKSQSTNNQSKANNVSQKSEENRHLKKTDSDKTQNQKTFGRCHSSSFDKKKLNTEQNNINSFKHCHSANFDSQDNQFKGRSLNKERLKQDCLHHSQKGKYSEDKRSGRVENSEDKWSKRKDYSEDKWSERNDHSEDNLSEKENCSEKSKYSEGCSKNKQYSEDKWSENKEDHPDDEKFSKFENIVHDQKQMYSPKQKSKHSHRAQSHVMSKKPKTDVSRINKSDCVQIKRDSKMKKKSSIEKSDKQYSKSSSSSSYSSSSHHNDKIDSFKSQPSIINKKEFKASFIQLEEPTEEEEDMMNELYCTTEFIEKRENNYIEISDDDDVNIIASFNENERSEEEEAPKKENFSFNSSTKFYSLFIEEENHIQNDEIDSEEKNEYDYEEKSEIDPEEKTNNKEDFNYENEEESENKNEIDSEENNKEGDSEEENEEKSEENNNNNNEDGYSEEINSKEEETEEEEYFEYNNNNNNKEEYSEDNSNNKEEYSEDNSNNKEEYFEYNNNNKEEYSEDNDNKEEDHFEENNNNSNNKEESEEENEEEIEMKIYKRKKCIKVLPKSIPKPKINFSDDDDYYDMVLIRNGNSIMLTPPKFLNNEQIKKKLYKKFGNRESEKNSANQLRNDIGGFISDIENDPCVNLSNILFEYSKNDFSFDKKHDLFEPERFGELDTHYRMRFKESTDIIEKEKQFPKFDVICEAFYSSLMMHTLVSYHKGNFEIMGRLSNSSVDNNFRFRLYINSDESEMTNIREKIKNEL